MGPGYDPPSLEPLPGEFVSRPPSPFIGRLERSIDRPAPRELHYSDLTKLPTTPQFRAPDLPPPPRGLSCSVCNCELIGIPGNILRPLCVVCYEMGFR